MLRLCTSYLSHCGSFSLYLQKIFSASIHVVLINNCSVNSSNFGVPLGGDKFRVFLAVLATPAQFFFFLMLWDIHSGDHHHSFISELFTECLSCDKTVLGSGDTVWNRIEK